jgi:CheY-like chemotaxis protein
MIDVTLKNANILIVDDQQTNIDLLEEFLSMGREASTSHHDQPEGGSFVFLLFSLL